ncbi:MAG: glycosyltransferase [Solirubrobacterales bacterium]
MGNAGVLDEGRQELDVRVQSRLPAGLPAGTRTSLFVLGSCFHRSLAVRRLSILVGPDSFAPIAQRMPRLDLFSALHEQVADAPDDPNSLSYRSGFWATVPVEMPAAGSVPLRLRAELSDGSLSELPLASIEATGPPGAPAAGPPGTTTTIAMATFNPDPGLFGAQVESIRSQTAEGWHCLISDDCSAPAHLREIRSALGGDERFELIENEQRVGFYRNFERALSKVPASSRFVALSDQDDRWYPEKLGALIEAIGDAKLAYCDQRIVNEAGAVLADTYWTDRRNNYSNLASLLIGNTITGAASLFRRELLDLALPFPETPGTQYHDQWLALVARCSGRIEYVDRPLYDYVQHGGAALGHKAANPLPRRAGARLLFQRVRRLQLRRFVSGWRAAYFFAYCRIRVLAETLLLRCGRSLSRRSARTLRRIVRAERSPLAFLWLNLRSARRWFGRTETLGGERILIGGILWRHIIAALVLGKARPEQGALYSRVVNRTVDASVPVPESGAGSAGSAVGDATARDMARVIRPIELSVSSGAPTRVNVLIPTVDLKHFFGGYIGKFNLALRLSQSGLRTRILTVDPTPPLPRDWRSRVESFAGLSGLFDEVELEFARDRDAPVAVSPDDRFVATTWWTAHVAGAAAAAVGGRRFLYLIQEYEPLTFPMGSWAALAMGSYELPHVALFSSELLREFFARRGYGVFAGGAEEGHAASVSFQNAITAITPPEPSEMARRRERRLLFYARPEGHGSRNMFELGLLGLSEAIAAGGFGPEWRFVGIGAVEGADRIQVAADRDLELLTRRDQADYAALLPAHDVGLSLMCTPHPSLVPIEMASAGMVTVTNSFENKTAEALSAISANLLTIPPSIEGVASGLSEAVAAADDFSARAAGSRVAWSSDWRDSLGPEVMDRVLELLGRC